jgi:hypothetical protein
VASSGINYFPSFDEISITMMLVVLAISAFRFIAKYFTVFIDEESHTEHVEIIKAQEALNS